MRLHSGCQPGLLSPEGLTRAEGSASRMVD